MNLYINGTGNISPQKTINHDFSLDELVIHHSNYKCYEPEYKKYISAPLLRRMSRIVKMGYCAAKTALKESEIEKPEAIITGTGLGCLEDTEKFLNNLIMDNEGVLSPTSFIQSTHNTVGSQIAILMQCHNYNSTYSSRGFSMESTLIDADIQIKENNYGNILVGAVDETTELSLLVAEKLGLFRTIATANQENNNSMIGEGAVYFALSAQQNDFSQARIAAVQQVYNPQTSQEVYSALELLLAKNNKTIKDIDLVLMGLKQSENNDFYNSMINDFFASHNIAHYKHLCGEYFTSSGFALWLTTQILYKRNYPDLIRYQHHDDREIKSILIYNQTGRKYHSLVLVENV